MECEWQTYCRRLVLDPLANDKILPVSKLKVYADTIFNVAKF